MSRAAASPAPISAIIGNGRDPHHQARGRAEVRQLRGPFLGRVIPWPDAPSSHRRLSTCARPEVAVRCARAKACIRRIAMELTGLEREFLKRLAHGPWASPPLFDHSLVARLVEGGLVQTETLPDGAVQYEIAEAGRAALAES